MSGFIDNAIESEYFLRGAITQTIGKDGKYNVRETFTISVVTSMMWKPSSSDSLL